METTSLTTEIVKEVVIKFYAAQGFIYVGDVEFIFYNDSHRVTLQHTHVDRPIAIQLYGATDDQFISYLENELIIRRLYFNNLQSIIKTDTNQKIMDVSFRTGSTPNDNCNE